MEKLNKRSDKQTEELQARVSELEKFRRVVVGRELKMVELKKGIKKIKDERRYKK